MENRTSVYHKLAAEFFSFGQQLVALLPDGYLGGRARFLFYRPFLKRAGSFTALSGLKIRNPSSVSIGARVSMNVNVTVDASGGGEISIGHGVIIGPGCIIRSADHVFEDPMRLIQDQGHRGGPILIEDDCWLASNVVVTEGVTIGKGTVVGAGSVVTHSLPPGSVAAGAPATVRKVRAGYPSSSALP